MWTFDCWISSASAQWPPATGPSEIIHRFVENTASTTRPHRSATSAGTWCMSSNRVRRSERSPPANHGPPTRSTPGASLHWATRARADCGEPVST